MSSFSCENESQSAWKMMEEIASPFRPPIYRPWPFDQKYPCINFANGCSRVRQVACAIESSCLLGFFVHRLTRRKIVRRIAWDGILSGMRRVSGKSEAPLLISCYSTPTVQYAVIFIIFGVSMVSYCILYSNMMFVQKDFAREDMLLFLSFLDSSRDILCLPSLLANALIYVVVDVYWCPIKALSGLYLHSHGASFIFGSIE